MKKIISTVRKYFAGVRHELKKISWPKKGDVVSHTIIVLASVIVAMIVVAALDLGLSEVIEYYISLS